MPAKLEPPPVQPTTTSGYSPALPSCSMASSPMTVWCMSTCESTEPRAYLASPPELTQASMASEMAMPREPGQAGSCSRIAAPVAVFAEGEGKMDAPQVSMKALR